MSDPYDLIEKVRRALGRERPLEIPPIPPIIHEPIARLVYSDIGLPALFIKNATAAKFKVETTSPEDVAGKIIAFLQTQNCKRIGLPISTLLDKLNLLQKLQAAGLDAKQWDELTLDETYDLDCGITDVYAAVAETGSLVIVPTPGHGRALSLIPPIHIAVIEPVNFVADLIDLFDRVARKTPLRNMTLITGPSKTADIEGHLVTGVHGPGIVQVFVLQ